MGWRHIQRNLRHPGGGSDYDRILPGGELQPLASLGGCGANTNNMTGWVCFGAAKTDGGQRLWAQFHEGSASDSLDGFLIREESSRKLMAGVVRTIAAATGLLLLLGAVVIVSIPIALIAEEGAQVSF